MKAFSALTESAQQLHGLGDYAKAVRDWQAAQAFAPDDLDRARALRGEASSSYRWVEADPSPELIVSPLALAERALERHLDLQGQAPDDYRVVREVPESARVVARILTLGSLRQEQAGGGMRLPDLHRALGISRIGDDSIEWMRGQQRNGMPDQHTINWWPTRAVVEAFAPDGQRRSALTYARRARDTAILSETTELPSAAHISREYAAKANLAARVKARAATAIACLATPEPSYRRSLAARMATATRPRILSRLV